MRIITLFYSAVFVVICLPVKTTATVVDSSAYGFTISLERQLEIKPDSLYNYLVRDIGQWWNPDHTWSGKASNLSIQSIANGCFCESLENEGSVRHMTVVFVNPGKVLRMEGGLGPLQMMAATGSMTFEIKPEGNEARITLHYTVGGYFPGGLQKWPRLVNQVLDEQLTRLIRYAEGRKG